MPGLISPSKITAWLDCAHTLTLHHLVDTGQLALDRGVVGEMAQMLMEKGQSHEVEVLERYAQNGRTIFEVPERDAGESFEAWVERVGNPLADGWDVIYQLPMIHDGMRGMADFLVRVEATDQTAEHYEAVDAKLARTDAKPGHVLQLCFYADALEAMTGHRGEHVHIELGSGVVETIRLDEVAPYWRRVKGDLARALDAASARKTTPDRNNHCNFCEFRTVCNDGWRATDSLVYVAGATAADRTALSDAGAETTALLAARQHAVPGIEARRLDRLRRQATLQVASRELPAGSAPVFELLETAEAGFAEIPRPDAGDIFLDFEGHPFWTAESGLFFLFGLIERTPAALSTPLAGVDSPDSEWQFVAFWAHDRAAEGEATQQLIEYIEARRKRFPNMHVYHYNHTERSSLERLTIEHGVAEVPLRQLIDRGVFVDLFAGVTGTIRLGAESYGLKHVEQLTGYQRGHDIDQGAGAVVEYERWMSAGDQAMLDRIAHYNEDDVRATRAVRDWLLAQRPDGAPWRPAVLDPDEPDVEVEERIAALHACGPDTPEHLMGDLLGYWRREDRSIAADTFRLSTAESETQHAVRSAITGLSLIGVEDQVSKRTGKPLKWPAAVFSYPEQPIAADIDDGTLVFAINEQSWMFCNFVSLDRDLRELRVDWNDKAQAHGVTPTSLVQYVRFRPAAKADALNVLADEMLTDGQAPRGARIGHTLLRREAPKFVEGGGPAHGDFVADLDDICRWATELDGAVIPIQGPPGTGKTFTGAHIIRTLVNAGLRVGITAMSYTAIDNLLHSTIDRFNESGDIDNLRAARTGPETRLSGVSFIKDNERLATGDYNVVGGTAWTHASTAMRAHPVDVLVVDEAGQLGLADTIAASISAKNVILLGDPQQLPQVVQAAHPAGSAASALGHILGVDATLDATRGVFLDTTWRMHPKVNEFISDITYDGRLGAHASCEQQTVASAGAGLRWLRAPGGECSTESVVEAELIAAQIRLLMNTPWTDQHGVTEKLRPKDFMVVAPYNDQVRQINEVFSSHKRLAKVEVGTVDKFQGREAAVVFYSMTSSSAEYMPRGNDFLFSKNRLNVAISRARCLAYLTCTESLLSTRAKTVNDMTMIGALCAFVERSDS